MKKQFIIAMISLFLSVSIYSQNTRLRRFTDDVDIAKTGTRLSKVAPNVVGSPYLFKMFASAKVSNVDFTVAMRYNVYKDEFEFINSKSDTLILNKTDLLNEITFVGTNTTYKLLNYNKKGKEVTGYLIVSHSKNDYTLYKKNNINFTSERLAKNSYESNYPAKFDQEKDDFYLKKGDDTILEFPSSKKGLLKMYPDKKVDIEAFIKKNNINFDKEADIIKLVDFLAG